MTNQEYDKMFGRNFPEYIICAAIWYKDLVSTNEDHLRIKGMQPYNVDKGIVISGWRHGNCIALCKAQTGLRTVQFASDAVGDHKQGFLTSKNRFLDRKEAAKLAFEIGQIDKETDELFSEDLY
jgi:hypothetical protein